MNPLDDKLGLVHLALKPVVSVCSFGWLKLFILWIPVESLRVSWVSVLQRTAFSIFIILFSESIKPAEGFI